MRLELKILVHVYWLFTYPGVEILSFFCVEGFERSVRSCLLFIPFCFVTGRRIWSVHSENSLVFRTLRGAFMQWGRIIEIENESTFSSVQIVSGAKGS